MFAPDPAQCTLLYVKDVVGFYRVDPKVYNPLSSSYYYWKNIEQPDWYGPFVTISDAVTHYERSLLPIPAPDPSIVISVDFTKKQRI